MAHPLCFPSLAILERAALVTPTGRHVGTRLQISWAHSRGGLTKLLTTVNNSRASTCQEIRYPRSNFRPGPQGGLDKCRPSK
eukprot:12852775-Alexandrium_andersonii.AAC.1